MLASKKLTMIDHRIAQLKNDWIGPGTLAALYGLTLPELERDFIRWGRLQRRPREVIRGDQVSRFALESYFQQRKVLPIKWAAAKLGMAEAALVNAIAALEASGRVDSMRNSSESLVPEDMDRVFIGALPPLQNQTFGNHDDFCKRLHEAISNDLGPDLPAPL
jgi:hypothetical protein